MLIGRLTASLAVVLAAFLAFVSTALASPLATPADDVRALEAHISRAEAAVQAGDVEGARSAYAAYDEEWGRVEDGVKASSRPAYRSIEDAMGDVKIALRTEPVDRAKVSAALAELKRRGREFSADQPSAGAEPAAQDLPAADGQAGFDALVGNLDRADAAIKSDNASAAAAEVRAFQRAWPAVEGLVKAKSPAVYTSTENHMADASARLASTPPDLAGAGQVVATMRADLAPFAEQGVSYGVFDAAIIMLREGLEALLVIAALLAFLKKAGRPEEQRWIWSGSLAGVVLSILVAFGAQAVFSRAAAAVGSELIEGVTGLIAAAMLFYVSHWLHEKSRLGAWNRYIHDRGTAALAQNSVLSLALIAFLAVFREGAETVLFYIGIAPSISPADLLTGIGLGVAVLVVVGVALLGLGMRLPLRPFFLASSALIYYLGFKFVGTGLHALQVAGVLPATPAPLPTSELIGLFPTWQTALAQLALLLAAAGVLIYSARQSAGRRPEAAAVS